MSSSNLFLEMFLNDVKTLTHKCEPIVAWQLFKLSQHYWSPPYRYCYIMILSYIYPAFLRHTPRLDLHAEYWMTKFLKMATDKINRPTGYRMTAEIKRKVSSWYWSNLIILNKTLKILIYPNIKNIHVHLNKKPLQKSLDPNTIVKNTALFLAQGAVFEVFNKYAIMARFELHYGLLSTVAYFSRTCMHGKV